jgi:hypothetical protein
LLIAPLTFITFLVSLALIDSHNTSMRSSSPPSTIYRIRNFLYSICFKEVGRDPYARVKSPDATEQSTTKGKAREEEAWHWHTKQRHMMKAEFDDAFRLRNSVAVGLLGVILGFVVSVAMGVRWVWRLVRGDV